MLHAVDFISLDTFEALAPASDLAALSLGDPGVEAPDNLMQFPWYSRLELLDVDPRCYELVDPEYAFQPWQARAMIEFFERIHQDEAKWRLVVHCTYGSSRSAAAALIAQTLTRCDMPRMPEASGANAWMIHLAQRDLGPSLVVPPVPEPDTHVYLPGRLQI